MVFQKITPAFFRPSLSIHVLRLLEANLKSIAKSSKCSEKNKSKEAQNPLYCHLVPPSCNFKTTVRCNFKYVGTPHYIEAKERGVKRKHKASGRVISNGESKGWTCEDADGFRRSWCDLLDRKQQMSEDTAQQGSNNSSIRLATTTTGPIIDV